MMFLTHWKFSYQQLCYDFEALQLFVVNVILIKYKYRYYYIGKSQRLFSVIHYCISAGAIPANGRGGRESTL